MSTLNTNQLLRELPPVTNIEYRDVQERAMRRVEEREHLRLELKAREYIEVVHQVIDTLVAGKEEVPLEAGSEPVSVPLDRARVAALKTAMDGSLRLLDRVLPPLKAIEVSDSPEKTMDTLSMTTSELLKLAGHMQDLTVIDQAPTQVVTEDTPSFPWD